MCGIVGFNWLNERVIESATAILAHRGPDAGDVCVDDRVSFKAILQIPEVERKVNF